MTDLKRHASEISKRLKKLYPEPVVELDYTTPIELIIASQTRDLGNIP